MTDRELLELAAKAVGIEVTAIVAEGIPHRFGGGYWNPLNDDGDALRLAVNLGFTVKVMEDHVKVGWPGCAEWIGETCLQCDRAALPKATRHAIVRAAAEIGRSA